MIPQEETQQQDSHVKLDLEGTPIGLNDEVVFSQAGLMGRGRVIATTLPNTFGCVVVQSLVERSRTMLVVARNCVVSQKAAV